MDWTLDMVFHVVNASLAMWILIQVNATIAIFVFVPLVAIILVAQAATRRLQQTRVASRAATSRVTGALGEIFGAVQAVQIAHAEHGVVDYFRRLSEVRRQAALRERAITLVTEEIFSRFDGSVIDGKALAYGHSYTGNALGCAAAKASLEVFESENVLENLQPKIRQMRAELEELRSHPFIAEVRQRGFIAGIELATQPGWSPSEVSKLGADVCRAAQGRGLLTRLTGWRQRSWTWQALLTQSGLTLSWLARLPKIGLPRSCRAAGLTTSLAPMTSAMSACGMS